jgi:hypothetical protein
MLRTAGRLGLRRLPCSSNKWFSTSTGLKGIEALSEKPVAVTPEYAVIARHEFLATIASSLNPWFLRIYKDFKSRALPSQQLGTAFTHTERILLAMNKKGSIGNRFLQRRFDDMARQVGTTCNKSLIRGSTDKELQCCAAFMGMALPSALSQWREFDQKMKELMDSDACSVDTGLLAVSALLLAKKNNFYSESLKSPLAVMALINRQKELMKTAGWQGTVFDFSDQVKPTFNKPTSGMIPEELFSTVGSGMVRDSKEVERLGALFNLLALVPEARKEFAANVRDVVEYGEKALSTQQNPVRLSTLRAVWEIAPEANLMNAYSFYKALYQQVLYSITCEKLQLVHQEEAIAKLIKSMILTNFKSSQLINKVFQVVTEQGIDLKVHGMTLYNDLLQLDCPEFANTILDQYMDNYIKGGANRGRNGGKQQGLSEAAQKNFLTRLATKTKFELGDLVMLLAHSGTAEIAANTAQAPALLKKVETELAANVRGLNVHQAVQLLRAYGTAGRLYPPIVNALNKIVAQHAAQQPDGAVSGALWASAHINDGDAEYIPILAEAYFKRLKKASSFSGGSLYTLVTMLWSLSVLGKLELWQFELAREMLEGYVRARGGQGLEEWACGQLQQVWNEAQILMEREEARTGVAIERPAQVSAGDPTSLLPWRAQKVRFTFEDSESSRAHLDLSHVLNRLGIPHKNEARMPNGYLVDVFIPVSSLPLLKGSKNGGESADSFVLEGNTTPRTAVNWMAGMSQLSENAALKQELRRTRYQRKHGELPEGEAADKASGADGAEAGTDTLAVDATISREVDPLARSKPCTGVVLEYDGPYHYESYMNVRFLCSLRFKLFSHGFHGFFVLARARYHRDEAAPPGGAGLARDQRVLLELPAGPARGA